jgi:OPA family glycerol-3-phosphate transporter-like MFS transporter 3
MELNYLLNRLFYLKESSDSKLSNGLLMTIVGFFIGGASNMIASTVTADLGKQGGIKGNKEGLATVTGIVDGTGSVGAAIGQILVPLVQNSFDWYYVFYLFIILVNLL